MTHGTVHQDIMIAVKRAAEIELGEIAHVGFSRLNFGKRIPMVEALAVWTFLASHDVDGTLGARLGSHQLSNGGVLGALLSAAGAQETMGRAMRVLSRYYGLVSSSAELGIELRSVGESQEFVIRSMNGAGFRNQVVVQSTLHVLLAGIRDISACRTPLLRVTFAAPVVPQVRARLAQIFHAPVESSAGADSLVFEGAFAEYELPRSLREDRSEVRAASELPLLDEERTPFQEEVIKEIQLILPMSPKLKAIANRLGLTARSFQRRLKAENVCFRDLCLETRLDFAFGYLRVGGAVEEVAYLVGYSDATAFTHAYRNARGHPPLEDRLVRPPLRGA